MYCFGRKTWIFCHSCVISLHRTGWWRWVMQEVRPSRSIHSRLTPSSGQSSPYQYRFQSSKKHQWMQVYIHKSGVEDCACELFSAWTLVNKDYDGEFLANIQVQIQWAISITDKFVLVVFIQSKQILKMTF